MAASAHLYPTNQTRLAQKIEHIVTLAQELHAELSDLNGTLGQIAADGAQSLTDKTGYATAEDASAAQAVLASTANELAADGAFQQMISRMG